MDDLTLFLESDRPEAKNLIDCYHYNQRSADQHISRGEFKKASVCNMNMAKNMSDLQTLRNEKETEQDRWLQLKQIEGSLAIRRDMF